MNAFELYSSVFDSSNEYAEATASYVQQYASGAFDIEVSDEVAAKIVECHLAYEAAAEQSGEGQNERWHLVQKPLENIEL